MGVKVSFKSEHIFSGTATHSGLMFWHAVILPEEYDWDTVKGRLREIFLEQGIHSELWPESRKINLAPAFKVELETSLFDREDSK